MGVMERAEQVEVRLAVFTEHRLITGWERRGGMPHRWVVTPLSAAEGERVELDTVRDGEMFCAGVVAAAYAITQDIAEGIGEDEQVVVHPFTGQLQSRREVEADLTRRGRDRYAAALNELADL